MYRCSRPLDSPEDNNLYRRNKMDAKDKRIAELEKALENAQNNVASPCGYLDVWKDSSGSFRREYTTEWLLDHAEKAKQNDGIIGMRYQLQKATNQTPNTIASLQVYLSHCVDYEQDNTQKKEMGVTYQNAQFSKNVGGRNYWKNPPREKVAVASVN